LLTTIAADLAWRGRRFVGRSAL